MYVPIGNENDKSVVFLKIQCLKSDLRIRHLRIITTQNDKREHFSNDL